MEMRLGRCLIVSTGGLNALIRRYATSIYSFITSEDPDPPHWDDPDSHHVVLRQTVLLVEKTFELLDPEPQ